ncbi:hypothetical protein C8J57DRAFT_1486762 [Mycena rebaudengoi]|nr:hypothetical protein C8J57DRAFT_1486762 [Mycena rebaudengoi]
MSLPLRIVLTAAIALIASITFVAATTRIRPSTARSAHWAGTAAELREVASIRNRENVPRGRLRLASRDRDFFAGWWRGVFSFFLSFWLRADSAEIAVVEIDKDGGVHISGNAGVAYGQWAGTLGRLTPRSSSPQASSPLSPSPMATTSRALLSTIAPPVLFLRLRQNTIRCSTPFEHAPRSTSDISEHQSGGAFVPADTAGMGVWGGGGGRARGSRRVLTWTVDRTLNNLQAKGIRLESPLMR